MLMKVKDRRTIKEKRRRRDGGTKRARERERVGVGGVGNRDSSRGRMERESFPYQLHFKPPGF